MIKTITTFLISSKPDPRFEKRIELALKYSEVHLIFWNRSGVSGMYSYNGCIIHEINIKTKDSIVKRLPFYKTFSRKALRLLNKISPTIIHVSGLDMLKIAYKYRKKKAAHLIYEVPDLPHLLVDKPSSFITFLIQKYLQKLESKILKVVDLLIVTSPRFITIRYKDLIPNGKILYFANVPENKCFETYSKKRHKPFTLGYIGAVRYKEQMHNFLTCAKSSQANFLIAGFESSGNEIESEAKMIDNVQWFGPFSFVEKAAELYGKCDAIYSVYDAEMKNVRVALPNKLYESIYCELPIIVAKNTYLSELVEEWGVGISVDCHSADDLIRALEKLMNDEDFYLNIVENCKMHKAETLLETYNNRLMSFISKNILKE